MGNSYRTINEVKAAIPGWRSKQSVYSEPAEIHSVFKLSFECDYLKEVLTYRFIELIEAAILLYENSNFVGSAILARSSQETISVLFCLHEEIKNTVEVKNVSRLKQQLKVMTLGATNHEILPQRINVVTLIGKVDKIIPGFNKNYNTLSEFAHPNRDGTFGLFAKPGKEFHQIHFGRYIRSKAYLKGRIKNTITTMALILDYINSGFDNSLSKLVELCDELHQKSELYPLLSPKDDDQKAP